MKRKQKFSVFLIYIFHYFLFSFGEIVFPSQIFGVLRKISFTSLSHSQYSVFCWFFLFTIPIEFFIPSWIFLSCTSMFRWNLICLQNSAQNSPKVFPSKTKTENEIFEHDSFLSFGWRVVYVESCRSGKLQRYERQIERKFMFRI